LLIKFSIRAGEEPDYDEMLKKMLDDNRREAEEIIYKQKASTDELTEEEQIEKAVTEAFDGYQPQFEVDVDKVMGKMDDDMDNIGLGDKYDKLPKFEEEKKGFRVLNDAGNDIKSPVIKFRPVHSVRVNETKYWTNETYKEETLYEIIDTITRGMKCRIVVQGIDEGDLTSLLHSIYHEEEIKSTVRLAKNGAVGLMGVPKITFDIAEDGIDGFMTVYAK